MWSCRGAPGIRSPRCLDQSGAAEIYSSPQLEVVLALAGIDEWQGLCPASQTAWARYRHSRICCGHRWATRQHWDGSGFAAVLRWIWRFVSSMRLVCGGIGTRGTCRVNAISGRSILERWDEAPLACIWQKTKGRSALPAICLVPIARDSKFTRGKAMSQSIRASRRVCRDVSTEFSR